MKPEQRANIVMSTNNQRYSIDVYLRWPKNYYAGEYIVSNKVYIGRGRTLEEAMTNFHLDMFPLKRKGLCGI